MLQDFVWYTISKSKHIDDLILMENGAPAQFAIIAREWLVGPNVSWIQENPDFTVFYGATPSNKQLTYLRRPIQEVG